MHRETKNILILLALNIVAWIFVWKFPGISIHVGRAVVSLAKITSGSIN